MGWIMNYFVRFSANGKRYVSKTSGNPLIEIAKDTLSVAAESCLNVQLSLQPYNKTLCNMRNKFDSANVRYCVYILNYCIRLSQSSTKFIVYHGNVYGYKG